MLALFNLAMTFALVACAAVLGRNQASVDGLEPGFEPENLVALRLNVPADRYPDATQVDAFYADAIRRVRSLGDATEVATASGLTPVFAQERDAFQVRGPGLPASYAVPSAAYLQVSPAYFRTLGAIVADGREFAESDVHDGEAVAVISDALARRCFPTGGAIGAQIAFDGGDAPKWRTIVGIAPNLHYAGDVFSRAEDAVYVPSAQEPFRAMFLLVRSDSAPEEVARQVRVVISSLDPDVPVARATGMREVFDSAAAAQRGSAYVVILLAAIALLLLPVSLRRLRGTVMRRGVIPGGLPKLTRRRVGLSVVPFTVLVLGVVAAIGLVSVFSDILICTDARDRAEVLIAAVLLAIVALGSLSQQAHWRLSGRSPRLPGRM
jgi:putative ABC transport system permease protein